MSPSLGLSLLVRFELKRTMKGTRSLSRSAGKREGGGEQFSAEARLRQCGRSTRTLTWFSNSPNRQPCPSQGRASRTILQPWSEPGKVYCVNRIADIKSIWASSSCHVSRSQPAQRRCRWRQLGRLQQCRAGWAGGGQLEYNIYYMLMYILYPQVQSKVRRRRATRWLRWWSSTFWQSYYR